MAARIEDYALLGDGRSAALVDRHGSIDWLCWPSFDSDTCFAALLGDARNGRWRIAPREAVLSAKRCYRGQGLILETTLVAGSGIGHTDGLDGLGRDAARARASACAARALRCPSNAN